MCVYVRLDRPLKSFALSVTCSRIYLFNSYSNGGYCMAAKMVRVLSSVRAICSTMTSAIIRILHNNSDDEWLRHVNWWSFARGSIVGYRQQQNWEQRISVLYLVLSYTPIHLLNIMSAFSCPYIKPSLLLSARCAWSVCVCNTTCVSPSACQLVSPAMKVVHSCSLRSIYSHSGLCIDCLCLTQTCSRMSYIPLVIKHNRNFTKRT